MTADNADLWVDATKLWPCWPMAHAVTRERDRDWRGYPRLTAWTWLCSDINRDRPAHLPPRKDTPAVETVFLTDGTTFLGPYTPGDLALVRGERTLREVSNAPDVYRLRAATLEQAKRVWAAHKTEARPRRR